MLWDGDRLIQEYSDTHVYTTIYDQGSFVPIARAVWLKEGVTLAVNDEPDNSYDDSKPKQSDMQVFYYHNDQLGTPNELTNEDGEVVWFADYELGERGISKALLCPSARRELCSSKYR